MRSLWFSLLILALLVLLAACATLEVGIEHTPTPDYAALHLRPTLTAPPLPSPTSTPLPTAAVSLSVRLVYESAGDIWIVERDHSPRVLLSGGRNPHLSPTGDRLVFFRANPEWPSLSDLWLADFTCPAAPAPCQVNERRLVGPAEFGGPLVYGLAWSPDGRTVALTTGLVPSAFTARIFGW